MIQSHEMIMLNMNTSSMICTNLIGKYCHHKYRDQLSTQIIGVEINHTFNINLCDLGLLICYLDPSSDTPWYCLCRSFDKMEHCQHRIIK